MHVLYKYSWGPTGTLQVRWEHVRCFDGSPQHFCMERMINESAFRLWVSVLARVSGLQSLCAEISANLSHGRVRFDLQVCVAQALQPSSCWVIYTCVLANREDISGTTRSVVTIGANLLQVRVCV